MTDGYPWGNKTPAQRIAALDAQVRANEKKRTDAVEAHRKKIVEIDETDRQLKADLRQANQILEREKREANATALSRVFDRVIGASGLDLDAVIGGDFEKLLQNAVAEAASKGKAKSKPGAAAKGGTEPKADGGGSAKDGEGGAGAPLLEGAEPAASA